MRSASSDGRIENHAPENRDIENAMNATTLKTKNLYNRMEWAGAFGDVNGRDSPPPAGIRCIPPDPGVTSTSVGTWAAASQRPSGDQES